jgi:hypothetical protein
MKRLLVVYLLGLFTGGNIGFLVSTLVWVPAFTSVQSQDLPAAELDAEWIEHELPVMDVLVKFVAEKDFRYKDAVAYERDASRLGHLPCTVTLRAGTVVRAYPSRQLAFWKNLNSQNHVLAHEFLHCVYHNWHQPWTDKYDKERVQ